MIFLKEKNLQKQNYFLLKSKKSKDSKFPHLSEVSLSLTHTSPKSKELPD
jgi:hypothetical protein